MIIAVMISVRREAERTRTLLLNDLRIVTAEDYADSLVLRATLFLSSTDDAFYVKAGFLHITTSFLFNFFGFIVSYIAMLAPSVAGLKAGGSPIIMLTQDEMKH